jgi:hypothetical protein
LPGERQGRSRRDHQPIGFKVNIIRGSKQMRITGTRSES